MTYISVARKIVNFNNEEETTDYIYDAISFISTNYKNKYTFTFNGQEFNSQIELLNLLMNIISKLKVEINNPSICSVNCDVLDNPSICSVNCDVLDNYSIITKVFDV